ncbi:MAG: hypothetical protein B2I17_04625 [Thermoplasmatales archaeon B_DKE]|nr:MAG: hypothetical protein B2I17_04625 [Thermoplasmatales archaeon B_DKE]
MPGMVWRSFISSMSAYQIRYSSILFTSFYMVWSTLRYESTLGFPRFMRKTFPFRVNGSTS